MKILLSGAAAILLGIALVGCTTLQGGKTIVKYDTSSAQGNIQAKAPAAGTYGLFASTDIQPIARVDIPAGQPLGFRRNDQGQMEAFAGDQVFPVDPANNYYWKKL